MQKRNKSRTQEWLVKHYGRSAPTKTTICRWFSEFKYSHTSTNDATLSGLPTAALIPETTKEIYHIVLDDPKSESGGDSWHRKDVGRMCEKYFAWIFKNEIALSKMDTSFTNKRRKIATCL